MELIMISLTLKNCWKRNDSNLEMAVNEVVNSIHKKIFWFFKEQKCRQNVIFYKLKQYRNLYWRIKCNINEHYIYFEINITFSGPNAPFSETVFFKIRQENIFTSHIKFQNILSLKIDILTFYETSKIYVNKYIRGDKF